MFKFLDRIYEFSKRHSYLYPLFLLVKLVLYSVPLIQHEGLRGAGEWLGYRLKFAFRNRRLLNSPTLPYQPIDAFESRHGFKLLSWIEYVIYDEIFLERVYEFSILRENIKKHRGGVVIDFGVHHGLFIDFVRTWNPDLDFFGAELSPENHAAASTRFQDKKNVKLFNVGIGGKAREISIVLNPISSCQSIYSTQGEKTMAANIITPADFISAHNLKGREILLFKMDIEDAEKEVFENFDSVKDVLKSTVFFLIEIHEQINVAAIHSRLESVGLVFQERRGINYLFSKRFT